MHATLCGPRVSARLRAPTQRVERFVRLVLRAVVFLGERLAVDLLAEVRFLVLRAAVLFFAVVRLVDRLAVLAVRVDVVLRPVAALVDRLAVRFLAVRVAVDFFGDRLAVDLPAADGFAVVFRAVVFLAVVFLVDRLAVVALVERFVPVVFLDAAFRVVAM